MDNITNRYEETDALCADTDDHGIDDGVVDFNVNGPFEPDNITHRETNPLWQDTDNDSFSDGLDKGGWNVLVYFEATGEKMEGYPIVVTTDPFDSDIDNDSLTDGQEFENAKDSTTS